MSKNLKDTVACAVSNHYLKAQEYIRALHRLKIAQNDVEYYSKQASKTLDELITARSLVDDGYLALMNSGISHHDFLRFVEFMEGK